MTFREKLQMEQPKVDLDNAVYNTCPIDWGYEAEDDYTKCNPSECGACWNREMPTTKEEETQTLPNDEFIEPKCTFETEVENAYTKGLNDAWESAKKLYNNGKIGELANIFGLGCTFFDVMDMKPQEALAKLKAYEDSKIEVGDVVFNRDTNGYCVISLINSENAYCLYSDGSCGRSDRKDVEKTDKHIDIKNMLKELERIV